MNFQDIWQGSLREIIFGIILGLVQGITEFLPISSTAHLRLISGILTGRDIGLTTSNIIQFGTLLAILQYFRKDLVVFWHRIWHILGNNLEMQKFITTFQNWTKGTENFVQENSDDNLADLEIENSQIKNQKNYLEVLEKKGLQTKNSENQKTDIILSQLLVGTLPIIILGFLLKSFAESHRNIREIGIFMIIGAILLALSEYFHLKTKKLKHTQTLNFGETILIGIFQSLAIFPGMSRSGSTLAGSLFLGRDRAESVRFAFLLSIPALFLSGIVDIIKLFQDIAKNGINLLPSTTFDSGEKIKLSIITLILTFILSYLSGLFCLKWLLRFLSKNTNFGFIIYRIILGIFLILIGFINYSFGYLRL